MTGFGERLVRAAMLHVDTYEEVEADTSATPQAFLVVLLSALGLGVGAIENHGAIGVLWSTVHAVVLWYIWAFVTYFIGTRFLPTDETVADHGELLRTIGFSSAPGILRVFMLVPAISGPVFFLCTGWMLVSMVVGVRQALDYAGTGRAIAVCAIGFPVYAFGLLTSVLLLGPWPV
jgi:hypothetical protein